VLPLADFNTSYFGVDSTGVAGTNSAKISSVSGAVGSFNPSTVLDITMTADNGTVKALPSALSTDQTSFSDAWYSPGP